MVTFHHLYRIADVSNTSLGKDIHLFQADFFSRIHVVLRRWKSFGGQINGGIICDRILGNQHASSMDGTLAWKIAQALSDSQNLPPYFSLSDEGFGIALHLFDFSFR